MKFICEKDGYKIKTTWSDLSNSRYKCYNCERTKYFQKLIAHIQDNKMPIKVIGQYINSYTPIKCICTLCGEEFKITPNSIITQNAIHRKCAYKINGQKTIVPKDEFLNRLKEKIHILHI